MEENDSRQQLLFSPDLHTRVAELYTPPETVNTPEGRLKKLESEAGALAVSPEDLFNT